MTEGPAVEASLRTVPHAEEPFSNNCNASDDIDDADDHISLIGSPLIEREPEDLSMVDSSDTSNVKASLRTVPKALVLDRKRSGSNPPDYKGIDKSLLTLSSKSKFCFFDKPETINSTVSSSRIKKNATH